MVVCDPHPLVRPEPGGLCWKRSDRRSYSGTPQQHAELVVLHALSGEALYLIDGKVHTLRAGSLLWAFSGQAHVLLSDSKDFDMWVFLISARILLPELRAVPEMPQLTVDERTGPVPPRGLTAQGSRELETIAAGIASATEPAVCAIGLRWWLARAWHHWGVASAGRFTAVHPAVDRAARAIQEDPASSLSEIARRSGLSAGRLGRLFRQQTGRSIVDFRTEQKLERVDRIMRQDARSDLLHAALDAGFGSYSQFYRAFRSHYRMSPRQYFAGERNPPAVSDAKDR